MVLTTNFGDLLDKIFGTIANPHNSEETKEAIRGLSVSELICARAYLGQREAQFKEINSRIDAVLNEKDISEFPAENTLFSVTDSVASSVVGGVKVETKIDTIRSTSNKRTAEKVRDEIARLGLNAQYTKTSIELRNDVLFADKAKGNVLPASLDGLLSTEERRKRVTSFVPIKTEEN